MKRITKQEAIESFGKESVQVAMSQGAEPTRGCVKTKMTTLQSYRL